MPSKQQSIILGGLVAGLLSTSYLGLINMLCCAGVIIGAMVAVWHYADTNDLTVKPGNGAVLGIMAALFGWALATILNFILIKAGVRHDLVFTQFLLDKVGDSMPPETYDQLIDQMNMEITLVKYMVNSLWGILFSLIFGAVGGAIGSVAFKRGDDATDF